MIETFNFQKFYSKWYVVYYFHQSVNNKEFCTWTNMIGFYGCWCDSFILPRMHKYLITTVQYLVLFQEIDMVLHHTKVCGQK
jgi:hypothetical protein